MPNFDNDREWIAIVESEKGQIRDGDIYPKLKAWINNIDPSEILDIGSGQGICSDKIDLQKRNYTGIEQSPFLVDRAKQLYLSENRKFIMGDIYQMPFLDSTFDAAFSVAVWHLLANLKKAAGEMSRVLKSNGHFLIITANPKYDSFWKNLSTESEPIHLHRYDEMVNSLEAAHLKVQKTEEFRNFILIQGQK